MNSINKQILSAGKLLDYTIKFLFTSLLVLASLTAQAGVAGSRHDLGTGGTGQSTGGTDEVCVFCHTPHGSDTSAAVPLWNKVLPAATGYTRYSTLNTSSLDGTEVPVGSVSLACLSCHDGVQGMDVVINAPGSTAADTLLYDVGGIPLNGDVIMTNQSGDTIPMLGTDLTDDHPISIAYAGGGCAGGDADGATCTNAVFGDPDFNTAQKDTINSNPVWWVDNGGAGTREKTDMHLYTRTDNVAAGEPSVECGSCHDPHNDSTFSDTAPKSVAFLRVANAASIICTTCHIK